MYADDGRTPTAPFDTALSNRLDCIQLALDNSPHGVRRAVLELQRRWYTRNVPALFADERGR